MTLKLVGLFSALDLDLMLIAHIYIRVRVCKLRDTNLKHVIGGGGQRQQG